MERDKRGNVIPASEPESQEMLKQVQHDDNVKRALK